MDLENFPTTEMANEMMGMISPIYDDSYVAKWLFEVMSIPLELARNTVFDLRNQATPETATWSIPYWEQSYGIETNEALSLEERRKQVIRKRNFRKPMNPARIEMLVKELCGRGTDLVENVAPHTFEIKIDPGESQVNLDKVIDLVKEVKQSQKSFYIVFETPIALKIRAEPYNTTFPYILTGTKPEVANIGSITPLNLQASILGEGMEYSYPTAENEVKTRYEGFTENGGITAGVEAQSADVVYKICGKRKL